MRMRMRAPFDDATSLLRPHKRYGVALLGIVTALVGGLWLAEAVSLQNAVVLSAVLLLISPNILSLVTHGTADLLLAHGYTMDEWVAERRRTAMEDTLLHGVGGTTELEVPPGRHPVDRLECLLPEPAAAPGFSCPLCLRVRGAGTPALRLNPCGHLFCAGTGTATETEGSGCAGVLPWLRMRDDCPVCRGTVVVTPSG